MMMLLNLLDVIMHSWEKYLVGRYIICKDVHYTSGNPPGLAVVFRQLSS